MNNTFEELIRTIERETESDEQVSTILDDASLYGFSISSIRDIENKIDLVTVLSEKAGLIADAIFEVTDTISINEVANTFADYLEQA